MANMRTVMPALQRARPVKIANEGLSFARVTAPNQRRDTKIVKDMAPARSPAKSSTGSEPSEQ